MKRNDRISFLDSIISATPSFQSDGKVELKQDCRTLASPTLTMTMREKQLFRKTINTGSNGTLVARVSLRKKTAHLHGTPFPLRNKDREVLASPKLRRSPTTSKSVKNCFSLLARTHVNTQFLARVSLRKKTAYLHGTPSFWWR